jgi:hypothetical protein
MVDRGSFVAAALSACVLHCGGGDSSASDASSDVTLHEAAADSAADGPSDAAIDAMEAGPSYVYSDMTSAANWTTYHPALDADGVQGGTFDGRYVYLAPAFGTMVTQYDTTAAFASAGSWVSFDVSTLNAAAKQYFGAAFDGRYVYFVPNGSGLVVRYDSTAAFSTESSWSVFDTTTVSASATSYNGATFDGRYVYFLSFGGGTTRFDTTGSFSSAASWATYNPGIQAWGGAFDGRYVYCAPFTAQVPRYDTTAAFASPGSWTTFDTTALASNDAGASPNYEGASFDGRHAYFAANKDLRVVSFDTTATFASASSWLVFDASTILPANTALLLGGFDGRYVYVGSYQGSVARVDTQATFTDSAAWSTYPAGVGATVAFVFDGHYLYVAGSVGNGNQVARFDAKSPTALPPLPHFSGSFY